MTPLRVFIFRDADLRCSLFGLAALCDLGCHVAFTNTTALVTLHGRTLLSGTRIAPDSLWVFSLPSAPLQCQSVANAAMSIPSDTTFVRFAHATLSSPRISSLLRALRAGYLDSFPHLTAQLVVHHSRHTIAKAKGHLDQHRQGLHSTADTPASLNFAPSPEVSDRPLPNHTVYVKTVLVSDNLTVRFPMLFTTGNQYLFISTINGYILAEPMASRHHTEYLKAYQKTIYFSRTYGHLISFQCLDNETSSQLERLAQLQKITVQFRPPPPPIIERCTPKGPSAHTRIILSQHYQPLLQTLYSIYGTNSCPKSKSVLII